MCKKIKAFTLIEMLIVIVIIGILAAALVPRLQDVQARARDTKRKTDMTQIYNALLIYYDDRGYLPKTYSYSWADAGWVDRSSQSGGVYGTFSFLSFLAQAGIMTAVPLDPINNDPRTWTTGFSYGFYCYRTAPVGMYLRYNRETPTFQIVYQTSTGGTRDSYMTNCQ